jgi:hypothetical protein
VPVTGNENVPLRFLVAFSRINKKTDFNGCLDAISSLTLNGPAGKNEISFFGFSQVIFGTEPFWISASFLKSRGISFERDERSWPMHRADWKAKKRMADIFMDDVRSNPYGGSGGPGNFLSVGGVGVPGPDLLPLRIAAQPATTTKANAFATNGIFRRMANGYENKKSVLSFTFVNLSL